VLNPSNDAETETAVVDVMGGDASLSGTSPSRFGSIEPGTQG
jgi:hypothetical protein